MIHYLIENGVLHSTTKNPGGDKQSPKESHVTWRIAVGPCIVAECPKTHTVVKIVERISERSRFWHCGSYETIPADVYATYLEARGRRKAPTPEEYEKYKIKFV